MVHADASTFAANITKAEAYKQVLDQTKALIQDQRNWVCNLANASSLLYHAYHSLPAPSNAVNWAGFYVLDRSTPPSSSSATSSPSSPAKQSLLLGPFQGRVACQRIVFGRGVCGQAAAEKRSILVRDVLSWPGHIACDSASRSEVVVPIVVAGQLVAVIDVDCAVEGGFDESDVLALEELAALLGEGCDW